MIGGGADAVFRRVARYGDGWLMGGGTPDMFRAGAEKVRAAWRAAGRDGEPARRRSPTSRSVTAPRRWRTPYLRDYYAFLGDYADMIAASAATAEDTVRQYADGFAEAGCDELLFMPCSPDPGQVDLLAGAAR